MSLKFWVEELLNGNYDGVFNEMRDFLNAMHENDANHEFHGMEIDEVEVAVSEIYDVERGEAIFTYGKDVVGRIIDENDVDSWEYRLLTA